MENIGSIKKIKLIDPDSITITKTSGLYYSISINPSYASYLVTHLESASIKCIYESISFSENCEVTRAGRLYKVNISFTVAKPDVNTASLLSNIIGKKWLVELQDANQTTLLAGTKQCAMLFSANKSIPSSVNSRNQITITAAATFIESSKYLSLFV